MQLLPSDPAPSTAGAPQFVIGSVTYTDPGTASPVTLLNSSGSAVATSNRTTGVLMLEQELHPVQM